MGIFNHMNPNPNNNKVISNKSTFFISAYYKKSKDSLHLFINEINKYNNIIPYDCCLKEIVFFIYGSDIRDYLVTLKLDVRRAAIGSKIEDILNIYKYFNSMENYYIQNIPIDFQFKKNDIFSIMIYKNNGYVVKPITQNEGVFNLVFTN